MDTRQFRAYLAPTKGTKARFAESPLEDGPQLLEHCVWAELVRLGDRWRLVTGIVAEVKARSPHSAWENRWRFFRRTFSLLPPAEQAVARALSHSRDLWTSADDPRNLWERSPISYKIQEDGLIVSVLAECARMVQEGIVEARDEPRDRAYRLQLVLPAGRRASLVPVAVARPPRHQPRRAPANKGKSYPPEILAADEVGAMIRACSDSTLTGIRNRALILLLYHGGLGISEALGLRPQDIDLAGPTVRVARGKRGERTVVLSRPLLALIKRWLDVRRQQGFNDGGPFFCALTGRPLATPYLRSLLPRLGRTAGIKKRVHPHALRHSHAIELDRKGVPMPVIQKRLGHASLAVTSRYLAHLRNLTIIVPEGVGTLEPRAPLVLRPSADILARVSKAAGLSERDYEKTWILKTAAGTPLFLGSVRNVLSLLRGDHREDVSTWILQKFSTGDRGSSLP